MSPAAPAPAALPLPAEAELLYRLAGPDAGRAVPSDPIRWDALFRLAAQERALPVLNRHLRAVQGGAVPGDEGGQLQRSAVMAEFRMHHMRHRLLEVLERFDGAGIPVVLLKGAALGVTVYASFVERPMVDLDLLVPPERAGEAWELIRAMGWKPAFGEAFDGFYERQQHLCPLDDPHGMGLRIEIHTALLPEEHPFALETAEIWREAEEVRVGQWPARVPSARHMLLHLCVHFAWSHSMHSAAWRTFRDIDRLRAAGRVDWDELVDLARRTRATTCCYWTLRLASRMAGVPVPPRVLGELAPPLPGFALSALERYLVPALCPPAGWSQRTVWLSQALWEAAIQPGWSGHGRARPWQRSEDFLDATSKERGPQAEPAARSWTDRADRVRQLLRELSTLVPR